VKVNLISNPVNNTKNVNFTGYKWTKDEHGFKNFETSYIFDENNQDCYLEIYTLNTDENGNYYISDKARSRQGGADRIKMKPGSNKVNLTKTFGILPDKPFAYHYVVRDRGGRETVAIDAGDSIKENGVSFNVVAQNGSHVSKGGSMKLVNVDSQNVGIVYDENGKPKLDKALKARGENAIKTLTNVFGGTVAGLEKDIDAGKYDGYSRIISLPIFTRDDFSAHKYWIEDIFQPCNSLLNLNNYSSLQKKMFAHDLNFVSDGAFVNEGLQGVHFSNLLRWGTDSPYFRWFRASNLKNAPLSLGIYPKDTRNVSFKFVNSPKIYTQNSSGKVTEHNNDKYDPSKPTYIQFFDKRLVTDKEVNDPEKLIKTYSKLNTDKYYDLNTHDDSVFPYSFEVNPKTISQNLKRFNQHNDMLPKDERIPFNSYEASRIMSKNENFVVDGKFESGFETWDANTDIAKLSFVMSNNDLKNLKNLTPHEAEAEEDKIRLANWQVQDYTVEGGKYWTKKTDDILRMYVAQNLKNIDSQNPRKVFKEIMDNSNGKVFPKSLKTELYENEVDNVMSGLYKTSRKLSDEDKQSQVLEQLMNTPLESVEFGTNLVGVLASPLVSKRASTEDEIGVSRYDLFKQGNPNLPEEYKKSYDEMDGIYQHEMMNFAMNVLNDVNNKLPKENKLFDGNEVTEFGQYALPLIVPRIAKFSVVQALAPKVKVKYDDKSGEISYDYNALLNTHLQSLKLPKAASPEDEAILVLDKMKKGIPAISDSSKKLLTDSILTSLKGTSAESFKLADLIIDKTQSGLDWRIDATKDIADIDALRTHKQPFEDIWNDVCGFWSKFSKGIYEQNPNSYIVAEVTDEDALHDSAWGSQSPNYRNKSDILPKFFRNTGITANAQYSFYFYDIAKLFAKSFQDGSTIDGGQENSFVLAQHLKDALMSGDRAFLKAFSLPAIEFAYTFIGNHDKPRVLHCAALDMDMFYTDLTYPENRKFREQAYRLVTDNSMGPVTDNDLLNYDFDVISPKAVAMGMALRKGFIDVLNMYKNKMSQEEFDNNFKAISQAVADLSRGEFDGIRFDGDSFGVKPIDFNIKKVLEQAKKHHGFHISNPEVNEKFEDDVFENVMTPAITKVLAMMKLLVAMPGMPTLYDGDDAGATGYDTETKNMYLQGRQRIHNEWVEDEKNPKYKAFLAKYKKDFDKVMSLRKDPTNNALNNGAPFVLPMQYGKNPFGGDNTQYNIPAVIQQSTDGRMTISLFNLHRNTDSRKPHYDHEQPLHTKCVELPQITLNFDNEGDKDGSMGIGIQGIKPDTVFYNASNPDDHAKYYVNMSNGKYYIKKEGGFPIIVNDVSLVLKSNPDNAPLTFTGQYHLKQNINTLTNAYAPKEVTCGKQLSLCK